VKTPWQRCGEQHRTGDPEPKLERVRIGQRLDDRTSISHVLLLPIE
jgi:hypothetical protein